MCTQLLLTIKKNGVECMHWRRLLDEWIWHVTYQVLISSGVYWIFGIGFPLKQQRKQIVRVKIGNFVMKSKLNCLYEFAIAANCSRLLRYTGSLNPGWSASSSVPYISTFCTLSKSEIFLGNQKISPKSTRQIIKLLENLNDSQYCRFGIQFKILDQLKLL